jgi:hypothetical protein
MIAGAPVMVPDRESTTPVAEVSYEGPGPQRRLTIAFRIILALPHLIYAALVVIVALLATVVGWFAALYGPTCASMPNPGSRARRRRRGDRRRR